MHTYHAILLSYLKYGDHDAVLHCFTKETGFHSFFAKGIYAAKNKKKPYLFPLNSLQISITKPASDQSISRIMKLESAGKNYDFSTIADISILFFIADFLHQVLRQEDANAKLFASIENLLIELNEGQSDAYLVFIFQFLQISGIAPLYADKKFLNPESGLFEDVLTHSYFTEEVSVLWKNFMKADSLYDVRLKRAQRNIFLDTLMIYFQYHLTGFYIPQSLTVVREIFE